jgi:hypothetical protein
MTIKVPTYIQRNTQSQFWALYVQCPYCGDLHQHGGGSLAGPPDLGDRFSHCVFAEPRGYELVPGPEGMPKPKPLSMAEKGKRQRDYDQRAARGRALAR